MKTTLVGVCALLLSAAAYGQPPPVERDKCENLKALTLPRSAITVATLVAAGAFVSSAAPSSPPPPGAGPFADLPAFCRVAATLRPTSDSDIKIEVWMPAARWNGKFQGVGNGGWAGSISYGALANALRRGYAAASTDTGHAGDGGDGSFALGHPEKVIDFSHRAVHEMTVKAKAMITALYGVGPRRSYWNGCSSGGRQGLKEAQNFPDDYDGIVAGAPANYWTHLMASGVWYAHATLKDPASYIPPAKYALIQRAVLDACDARDGVTDGVLDDPRECRFDPAALQCGSADAAACLTAPQVEAARKIYAGPVNPRTHERIFPGLEPGAERGWGAMAGGPKPFPITADHFRYVVFKNPDWDFRTLDFDRDVALADRLDEGNLNAINPNLKAFVGRGGKLLMYHGWNDQLIAPRNTIDYYEKVVAALGPAAAETSIRLFMAPGMGHCGGGDGPSGADTMAAVEQWVEQGKAPDRLIASRSRNGVVDRTRPLCPYPQTARYTGTVSTDEAANFVCRIP